MLHSVTDAPPETAAVPMRGRRGLLAPRGGTTSAVRVIGTRLRKSNALDGGPGMEGGFHAAARLSEWHGRRKLHPTNPSPGNRRA